MLAEAVSEMEQRCMGAGRDERREGENTQQRQLATMTTCTRE